MAETLELPSLQNSGLDAPNTDAAPFTSTTQCSNHKYDKGWRRIVRNFTPAWFSVNMGTGIASILLYTLPYNGKWLQYISLSIFALNVACFLIFCFVAMLRYAMYPEVFRVMITHPAQSMFVGTFPMGLATIINMFCMACVPAWGYKAAYFAWGLWIFDALFSVVTAIGILFIVMTRKEQISLPTMTAGWLLPIVSCIVAAASGAIVAEILPNVQHALWTILISYCLWGIGVPFAMMVIAIYLQRLMLHKLPPKAVLVSVFLPLGPLGQGGFGIQKLGQAAKIIFPQTGTLDALAGEILYDIGFLVGLIMWAFGLVWLAFALASIIYARRFPFNLGWWAFTFPLGVFATCTCQLGRDLPSSVFDVLGTIFSLCVLIMWMLVSVHTGKGVIKGDLFVAPCLQNLKKKEESV